ncbi:GNAT family N-acetyltransferase [Agrococcus sp. ARC_14]|uniref:GNAT family N-acetyltransferase n=1 Tax=Agrococcus sp. ARC_14 TaxID=2919927 RepID=UPI001F06C22E|nr:GNAT family N-acetyltransferase [Agrococcus sp. ARC_14]MCH1883301.1 N-acetyltransferase [Agrococcus sp. ARC_14]
MSEQQSEQIEVVDNAAATRYEARIDGALAGFADYRDAEGVRAFTHTEVDSAFGGRGVGSTLVDEAMRATIAEGKRIKPICSFVVARSAADEFAAHVVH